MFSLLGTLFSSKNSLFIYLWTKYIFLSLYYDVVNNVNIQILSFDIFSKTTSCIIWAQYMRSPSFPPVLLKYFYVCIFLPSMIYY